MRKQRAAARGLPFQGRAEAVGGEGDQQQVGLPGEMLRGGLADLTGGGEVDEAVGEIDRRAGEDACRLCCAPGRLRNDLVDAHHGCSRMAASMRQTHGDVENLHKIGRKFRIWRETSLVFVKQAV